MSMVYGVLLGKESVYKPEHQIPQLVSNLTVHSGHRLGYQAANGGIQEGRLVEKRRVVEV